MLVGLGLRVGEQGGGVGRGRSRAAASAARARAGVAGLDLGEQGGDLGLGVAAVRERRTPGSRGAAGRRSATVESRSWASSAAWASCSRPQRSWWARSSCASRAMVPSCSSAGPLEQLRRPVPAPRARRASACSSATAIASSLALVARARSSDGLVGGVGEHDLDLGAGLLETALGLLARRAHGGLQLLQLVGRPPASRPAPGWPRPGPASPRGWRRLAAGRRGSGRG